MSKTRPKDTRCENEPPARDDRSRERHLEFLVSIVHIPVAMAMAEIRATSAQNFSDDSHFLPSRRCNRPGSNCGGTLTRTFPHPNTPS